MDALIRGEMILSGCRSTRRTSEMQHQIRSTQHTANSVDRFVIDATETERRMVATDSLSGPVRARTQGHVPCAKGAAYQQQSTPVFVRNNSK